MERFGGDSHDFITNTCDVPNDPNSFYDFGSTWVTGGFMPSIFKIDQSTLTATWTQVLRAVGSFKEEEEATAFAMGWQARNHMCRNQRSRLASG